MGNPMDVEWVDLDLGEVRMDIIGQNGNEGLHYAEVDPTGKDPHEPGAKLDVGKVYASLLADFSLALLAVAEVSTFGAKKYSRGGWQSVPDGITRYTDAKWRHLLKGRHQELDGDSGLLHAAHEAWNALAVLELKLRGVDKQPTGG